MSDLFEYEEELECSGNIEGASLLKGAIIWEGIDTWLPEAEAV